MHAYMYIGLTRARFACLIALDMYIYVDAFLLSCSPRRAGRSASSRC